MKVVRDGRALTDMCEDEDTRLSEGQKTAARRIICANAAGDTLAELVADAEEIMLALGVHPHQREDEQPMVASLAPVNSTHFIS
jgi:hypothetical protein